MKKIRQGIVTSLLIFGPLASIAVPAPPTIPNNSGSPIDGSLVVLSLVGAAIGYNQWKD